jgi:hypothetical protein
MYFAVDDFQIAPLQAQIINTMQAGPAHARWYALVDRAFDHERLSPLRWPHASEPVYRKAGMDAVSPALLSLNVPTSDAVRVDLVRLLNHCNGRPMLSFVRTELDMASLADAWQAITRVQTQDEQTLLLRFADARVHSTLPSSLGRQNWQRLCRPLLAWYTIDRAAQWQALPVPEPLDDGQDSSELATTQAPFCIDDAEFARMLDAAQPDVLIDAMAQRLPDVLPERNKARCHALVARACELARAHHLEGLDDQLALAVLACLSDGELLSHPALPDLLAAYQPGAGAGADKLSDTLMALWPATEEAG